MVASQAAIGTATVPSTSGGTIDLTSSFLNGASPTAALFILTADQTPEDANYGTINSEAVIAIGATDGTRQWSASMSEWDSTNTQSARQANTTVCITYSASGGGNIIDLSFNSWITNGVRLDVDTADGNTYRLLAILFVATQAYCSTVTMSTQDTDVDVTTPGFGSLTDQTVAFFTCIGTTFATASSNALLSIGMAANLTGGVAQACVAFTSHDNSAGTNLNTICWTDRVCGQLVSGAITWEGQCSNFDSSGFTMTARGGNSGSDVVGYLLLEFPSTVYLDQHDTPTATGINDWTGMAFRPQFALELCSDHDTVDQLETDGTGGGIGISIYDYANQYFSGYHSEDAADPWNGANCVDDVAFRLVNDAGTEVTVGTFIGFLPTGARRNFSTAPGTAQKWFGFALEEFNPQVPAGMQALGSGRI